MIQMQILEEDVIPILKDLIKIKTENPPGFTINAVSYISNIFNDKDIKNTIQKYGEKRANIIAEYGEGDKTILLTGHLDTVPAGDEEKWKFPPFEGIEDDGKIYGRGSTDMKGAVAAFIAIITKLKQNNINLNRRIVFLGTSDEEIGMDGAVVAKEKGVMKDCEFIVIGEPTELMVGVAEKGTLWINVKVRGKSAHGSTPHLGINSIEAASKLIPKMKEAVSEYEHEILGKSTLNIGEIKGGTLINVVPEYCEFRCDFRLVKDDLRERTKEKINEMIKEFNDKEEAKAEIDIIHEIPALELKEKTDFFEKLRGKAKDYDKDKLIGVNYGTDGAMLVPEQNTPFIIMGPGKFDQLHVTNEYTEKQEVIEYANLLYDAIIESYSQ